MSVTSVDATASSTNCSICSVDRFVRCIELFRFPMFASVCFHQKHSSPRTLEREIIVSQHKCSALSFCNSTFQDFRGTQPHCITAHAVLCSAFRMFLPALPAEHGFRWHR